MIAILFIIIGIWALYKKEIKVSSKRKITGRNATLLGWLFLSPFLIQIVGSVVAEAFNYEQTPPIFNLLEWLVIISVIIYAIYIAIFYKEK